MPENRILKTLEKYRIKNQDVPIIVEGKNDLVCLRSLDFEGNIIIFNTGSSLVNFSENVAESNNEVIILTDFDRKGVEIKENIQRNMAVLGCRVDTDLWDTLRRYVPISTVEELPFAVQRIIDDMQHNIIDRETIKRKWNS